MKVVAVLDNIRSLYNVGSIFRTSDGFLIGHLYLCGITGTPKDEFHKKRITKTSLGAQDSVNWSYHKNTVDVVKKLKDDGFTIIALEKTSNSIPINKFKLESTTSKIAVVIGHELFGVSESVLNVADHIVHIPMLGQKESFNVTVAYGISIHYLFSKLTS